ncbi:hypothetical protein N7532_000699 [Penicillium argentinense]|uniref:INO80 complex subunit F domain-containing protein n=1 Tax=Penicillium argentinense TaxID=1131581 RepID=A0A9W9G636_9EURO|nr:uncharacterized protein N7532_000699 [Penicillium argentinense]KAJ5112654.1 hypothetical protein N7532_000699 [Penicillium argentinense]
MEARAPTSVPSSNPPSVEIAYKRKCIALKKRLAEVEAENELMRTRSRRGWQYIQKMRLESCMLLERLAKVTGMTEEAQAGAGDPELRARAVAMMSNVASMNGLGGNASAGNGNYVEDETEGSSDEQPPTPEERPLRVKRSRKSNAAGEQAEEENQAQDNAGEAADRDALPRIAPAPSQQDLTSTFRVQSGNGVEGEDTPVAGSTASQDNREGQGEQPAEGADSGTTPMDVDTKEPKVE